MLRFTLRRVLQIIPTVVVVALLIFVIFSVVPGTFAASLFADGRRAADPQMIARLNEEFGLNKPLMERFATYVTDLAQFDLGTSFRTRQPVIACGPRCNWRSPPWSSLSSSACRSASLRR